MNQLHKRSMPPKHSKIQAGPSSNKRKRPLASTGPAAQPNCPLFLLPAELRNEIYLLVAEDSGLGILRQGDRDSVTSLDPLSLTCKYIRHEYLDVLSKRARTLVAQTTSAGFCNTILLRHEIADPNQESKRLKRKKSRRGRAGR